jgi:hypothetical protein
LYNQYSSTGLSAIVPGCVPEIVRQHCAHAGVPPPLPAQRLHLMNAHLRTRNVVMVLVGVTALLVKSWFRDSIGNLAHAYLGNLSASFAVFFLVSIAAAPRLNRIWIAAIALVIVEAFELTDGFGVMTNVYDPFDYMANVLGVALAFSVDFLSARTVQAISPGS